MFLAVLWREKLVKMNALYRKDLLQEVLFLLGVHLDKDCSCRGKPHRGEQEVVIESGSEIVYVGVPQFLDRLHRTQGASRNSHLSRLQ